MSTYELIAVRYQDTKQSNIMRSEFMPFEGQKAVAFYNKKKADGCYLLEINGIEIEHGGGEIKSET